MGIKEGLNKVFYKAGRTYGKVKTYPQKIRNEYDRARIQAQYDVPNTEVERIKRVEKKLNDKEQKLNEAEYMNGLRQRDKQLKTREYEMNLNIREQRLREKQERLTTSQKRTNTSNSGGLFSGTGLSTGSIFDTPKSVKVSSPRKKQRRQVKKRGRR